MGLVARIVSLVCLFVSELVVISIWLDTSTLDGKGHLAGAVGNFGHYILQSVVVFATILLAFGYARAKSFLPPISESLADLRPVWTLLAAHVAVMSVFACLSSLLFGAAPRLAGAPPVAWNPLVSAWLGAGLCGIATGVSFFIPPKALRQLLVSAGSAWIYAAAAAAVAPVLVVASKGLWKPTTALTFELVRSFLCPFIQNVTANPATGSLGTPKFSVEIAPACSGLEGVGLMVLFSVLWLWFFRGDYKFPQALVLIPIGVSVIFLLNVLRIAGLILIGNAGAAVIALGGFHSQAGWIAFNGVALAVASFARRAPWLSSGRKPAVMDGPKHIPTPILRPSWQSWPPP